MAWQADRRKVRNPVVGPRGGGLYVSESQYARLMEATFAVVAKDGYQGMAVRRVAERAGISSKTFYDLFEDREDCFLAAFDHGVSELTSRAHAAYAAERDWLAGVRAALAAVLGFLDGELALRRLLLVEALGAGPRVLARRAQVIRELAAVLDEGRTGAEAASELPPLTAEGVVGGALSVVHAHLADPHGGGRLIDLLSPLMATIVLPYRGPGAAARELTRKAPPQIARPAATDREDETNIARPLGSMPPVDFRLTVRTQAALAAVEQHPGVSNREVSELAGISDQGQVSRLMMRLQEQGLVQDTREQGSRSYGYAKAWRLTADGEAALRANGPLQPTRYAATHARKRERSLSVSPTASARAKGGASTPPTAKRAPSFRITPRTQLVLAAIARLAGGDSLGGQGPSNREISKAAGVKDQGQISKLLARLEGHGLLVNSGGATAGVPNAWQLTRKGEGILDAGQAQSESR